MAHGGPALDAQGIAADLLGADCGGPPGRRRENDRVNPSFTFSGVSSAIVRQIRPAVEMSHRKAGSAGTILICKEGTGLLWPILPAIRTQDRYWRKMASGGEGSNNLGRHLRNHLLS
jgi:hypothetical protein